MSKIIPTKVNQLNILLELGCEEIPARFMTGFLDDLKAKTEERLKKERLTAAKVETLGTNRRLVLYIENIPQQQQEVVEEIKGPPADLAFDPAGNPNQAALGFARSQGVVASQLFKRAVGPKEYVFAKVVRRGQPTEKLMQTVLPEIVAALCQPLAMRWGGLDVKFIRPIHSILALAGKKVIHFEIAGIKAANKTFSHRYKKATTAQLLINSAELSDYKKALLKLGVVVDQNERQVMIREQVKALAQKAGASAVIKDDLLSEVNFLVENPIAYIGKFNPDFLAVPQEVLITSMQKNQKYFPLIDRAGKLQAKFIVVTNGCPTAKVVEGNEKVLTARLSDARFFFEEDKKSTLNQKSPELAKVSFFEKLGNLQQKSERLARLAEWIGKRWGLDEAGLKTCRRIAELCKVDLTTKMVFEFPELQGVMGREYALASGENPKVAEGIFEHYLPRSIEDKTPLTIEGSVVAVADRLDTVVGAFLTGFVPSGSEDPYGIRRAVIGIIRIIMAGKFDLLLDEAIEQACKNYEALLPAAKEGGQAKKNILDFVAGRLKPLLLEKGIRYDIVDAVLYNFNDILDVVEKSAALNSIVAEDWLKGVVASADRLSKIAGKAPREQVLEHDLVEPEEKALHELYLKTNWAVAQEIKNEEWLAATGELAKLTVPIEHFFDKILVMHQDERLKLNRLALLKSFEKLYLSVADFRKLVL